jgi:hypothetical protein
MEGHFGTEYTVHCVPAFWLICHMRSDVEFYTFGIIPVLKKVQILDFWIKNLQHAFIYLCPFSYW